MRRWFALLLCLGLCVWLGVTAAGAEDAPADWVMPLWSDAQALGLTQGEGAWQAPVSTGELDRMADVVLGKLGQLIGVDAAPLGSVAQDNTRGEALRVFDLALRYCGLARESDSVRELQRLGVLRGRGDSWGLEQTCSRQEAMVMATRLILNEYDSVNAGSRGLLWRASHGGNTLYLWGTAPGAGQACFPLHRVLRQAVEEAEYLLVETQGQVSAVTAPELYAALAAGESAQAVRWAWSTGDAQALARLPAQDLGVVQTTLWAAACLDQEGSHTQLLAAPVGDALSAVPALVAAGYQVEPVTDFQATAPVPSPDPSFDIHLTFAGDCTLASFKGEYKPLNFQGRYQAHGPAYFLQNVRDIFHSDDFTVVNLENVFTDRPLAEREKGPVRAFWFKAPTHTTQVLTTAGVEAVSLANNHTMDYGAQGAADTREALDRAGVLWGDEDRTLYLEKNGYTLAVICAGLWDSGDVPPIVRRLGEADAQSDFQIVFFHGGTEGVYAPEQWKIHACHQLVDAGADLVLGNHPHVLQPREVYQGVDILYSLANFCFGGNNYPPNRTILYQLKLTVNSQGELAGKTGTILPCYVFTGTGQNNYCPAPIQDLQQRQLVLDFMDWRRARPF